MATLTTHATSEHIARYEGKLAIARDALVTLPGDDYYDQLWQIIHRPGWTTIAEGLYFEALVDSITTHAQTLNQLHQQLLNASSAVGNS